MRLPQPKSVDVLIKGNSDIGGFVLGVIQNSVSS